MVIKMNEDLIKIKKYYGEEMAHLCRELFPTILEEEGLLFELLSTNFDYSKELYNDIKENFKEEEFKNYLYQFINIDCKEVKTNKTPFELMDEAFYNLFECKSERDIQSFRKYYEESESLCTFNGGRLDRCHVFFAIKKDVDSIKREDFKNPKRQDKYGTSVISIQFTRGNENILSIKNRYNHTVANPDATYSNNLENIIPGLTDSFKKYYNLNINYNKNSFELPNYIKARDGKFYKYNYEINNIYYCPDNIIIDNFEVIKKYNKEKERYIVFDYFILDLKEKTMSFYDKRLEDSFIDTIGYIDKVNIINNKENNQKYINIDDDIKITLDKENRIIFYKNNKVEIIGNNFLFFNKIIDNIKLSNLKQVGNNFIRGNRNMTSLELPNLKQVGNQFLRNNRNIVSLELPQLEIAGHNFLYFNEIIDNVELPNLKQVGSSFLRENRNIISLKLPNLKQVENNFLCSNDILEELYLPFLKKIGNNFLKSNTDLSILELPSLETVGDNFLCKNRDLNTLSLPSLEIAGDDFLHGNRGLSTLSLPSLEQVKDRFLCNNTDLYYLFVPSLKCVGEDFLYCNGHLEKINLLKKDSLLYKLMNFNIFDNSKNKIKKKII
jgi:hypothetical protein